ncbi:MAG: phosphoribosylaminoimidazolesuccinocarboxamide synthase [Peptococcaceae bacterium]|jgi:hypothetical protein|nr:phosphoribosylaminoimidazolesuccinocarboxamide synthase [Peptococcaceae bacterium]
MSPTTKRLAEMIDYLPEQEQLILFEIVRRFLPDDVATPEDLTDIKAAREEYQRGETTPHEAINWF